MNQEIKQKWINALRSGEYKQTTNALRCGLDFCCLGVLSDICIKETGTGTWDYGAVINNITGAREGGILPTFVKEWADLTECSPKVGPDVLNSKYLSNLNDEGLPFNAIADLIEQYL